MIRRVQRGLNPEQVARIAYVTSHIDRHRTDRFEDSTENLRVRTDHRIAGIGDIGVDRSVVRIDHDLHAIAHVARTVGGALRVDVLAPAAVGRHLDLADRAPTGPGQAGNLIKSPAGYL